MSSVYNLCVSSNGKLTLKREYYQVKGQLLCTRKKFCKFVVYRLPLIGFEGLDVVDVVCDDVYSSPKSGNDNCTA